MAISEKTNAHYLDWVMAQQHPEKEKRESQL